MARKITKLTWEGKIPVTKWTLFYSRVLSLLAKKQGVDLHLILQSVPEGGISELEYRKIISALRDLDLDTTVQMEEEETDDPAVLQEEEPEFQEYEAPLDTKSERLRRTREGSDTPRHSRPSDSKVVPTQAEISGMPEHEVTLWKDWTAVARSVDQAGRNLHERFHGVPIATEQFREEVAKTSDYNPSGILITDYCYSLINEAPYSFCFPLFEFLERGTYRYLGANQAYNGLITWKPTGGNGPLTVGRWENGRCFLRYDPRAERAKRRNAWSMSENPSGWGSSTSRPGSKDYTKYQFRGSSYNKCRLVLAVVREHVRQHPDISMVQIQLAFPDKVQGSSGIIRPFKDVYQKGDLQRRFFMKQEDRVRIASGREEAVVCTQWGTGNIGQFLEQAARLGYEIKPE